MSATGVCVIVSISFITLAAFAPVFRSKPLLSCSAAEERIWPRRREAGYKTKVTQTKVTVNIWETSTEHCRNKLPTWNTKTNRKRKTAATETHILRSYWRVRAANFCILMPMRGNARKHKAFYRKHAFLWCTEASTTHLKSPCFIPLCRQQKRPPPPSLPLVHYLQLDYAACPESDNKVIGKRTHN